MPVGWYRLQDAAAALARLDSREAEMLPAADSVSLKDSTSGQIRGFCAAETALAATQSPGREGPSGSEPCRK